MRDEQERTIRGVLSDARDQTADIADQVKGAALGTRNGQARDSASQVSGAAGRSAGCPRATQPHRWKTLSATPSKTSLTPLRLLRSVSVGFQDACTGLCDHIHSREN